MSDSSVFYTPVEMHKIVLITNGIKKANLPLYKCIIAGIVSGFFVMIGAHGMVSLLSGSEANTKPVYLLSGIVFAVAIMSILILGGELFTSNCLLLITAIAGKITFAQVLKNWFIVYFANFAGSIFFSVMLFGTGMYGFGYDEHDHTAHAATLCKIVHGKVLPPAYQQFFRAVFANFCVCMACMLAAAARSVEGKVLGMVWPVMVFVVSGYEHSIANQGFFALATLVNCPTPHGWYWVNLSVTTPGNIVGAALIGISFYAVSLWRTEDDEKETKQPAGEHTAVVTIGEVLPPPPSSSSCNPSAADRYNQYQCNSSNSISAQAGQGSPSCQCAALAKRHVGGGVLALAMHKVESQGILDHQYVSSADVANNNTHNNTIYQQNHHHFSNVSPMPSGITTPVSAQPRGNLSSKMMTSSLFVQVPSSVAADAFCAANGCTSHYHHPTVASPLKKFSNQQTHDCCECGVPKRQADVSAESSHIFVQAPY